MLFTFLETLWSCWVLPYGLISGSLRQDPSEYSVTWMKSFCYGSNRLSAHVQGSLLPLPPSPLWSAAYQLQQPLLCNPPSTPRGPAGNGLGSLCRQQAGEAAQLISQVSQLPEITADPPAWCPRFSQPELHIFWPLFRGSLKPVAGQRLSCSSIFVNRVCHYRAQRALPLRARRRQVLLLGMVAMVLGVTAMEFLTRQHPAALVATVSLPSKM